MAYQICPKTTQENKDCKLREDDDIAKIVNNTEVESFDIKPEWLDDMSTKLDTYNAKQKMARNWWFLLLVPAIIAAVLIPSIIIDKQLQTANSSKKNKLIQNQSENISAQKRNAITSPNERSNAILETQARSHERISQSKKHETNSTNILKKPEEIPTGKKNSITKSKNTKKNDSETVNNSPVNLSTSSSTSVSSNISKAEKKKDVEVNKVDNRQSKLKTNISNESTGSDEIKATPLKNKSTNNQAEQITIIRNQGNDEQNELVLNIANLKAENVDTSSLESTAALPEISETILGTSTIDSSHAKERAVKAPQDSSVFTNNIESLTVSSKDKIDESNENDVENKQDNPEEKAEETKIESKEPKDKLWRVGLTLGPDFLTKEITSSSDLLNFEQQNKEELFDNTWGYDLELSRQITPWLTLGTGVGYKTYQEINSYGSETFFTLDTSYVITDISFYMFTDSSATDSVLIPNFLTIPKVNKDSIVDSSKQLANGKVTSSYVQIPINAQFTFVNSKKITAYTNLGLAIGLLTKSTGRVVDYNTDEIVSFTTRKMIYTSSIGLGINYNIFGPFDYKLYGAYQFQLSNLSTTPNIDKRYNGFTVRTGLVFRF